MAKPLIVALLIGSLLLSVLSCHKNNNNNLSDGNLIDIDSGKFLGLINNSKWHPVRHTATYVTQYSQLYIFARDDAYTGRTLFGGINLDVTNPLKEYLLVPNGDDAFEVNQYYSDNNVADAGGVFTLTKFDTVNKKVSGILQFTGYDRYRTPKVKFTSTIIEDLPLKYDTINALGNYASCTVQGANTTDWQTKNIEATIDCIYGNGEILYVRIGSMVADFVTGRSLLFIIPLKNSPGKYQVYPELPPYNYCSDIHIKSSYCSYNYDNKYYATSGELNIIGIDTALRKLKATFNVQYRDTTSKGEIVQISNGTIDLNWWIRMGEKRRS